MPAQRVVDNHWFCHPCGKPHPYTSFCIKKNNKPYSSCKKYIKDRGITFSTWEDFKHQVSSIISANGDLNAEYFFYAEEFSGEFVGFDPDRPTKDYVVFSNIISKKIYESFDIDQRKKRDKLGKDFWCVTYECRASIETCKKMRDQTDYRPFRACDQKYDCKGKTVIWIYEQHVRLSISHKHHPPTMSEHAKNLITAMTAAAANHNIRPLKLLTRIRGTLENENDPSQVRIGLVIGELQRQREQIKGTS